jgi:hypothetical protein
MMKKWSRKTVLGLFLSSTVVTIIWNFQQQIQISSRNQRQQHQVQERDLFTHASPETAASTSNHTSSRPPLETLLRMSKNNKILVQGNVSFLLDFGILGFGKCGTSTMMHWLADHPEIRAFRHEKFELVQRKLGSFVRQLYQELPADKDGIQYKRGYKSPRDIRYDHVLDYYRKHFVHAKIILGIRHPVTWFQSLYNYRVQNIRHDRRMPEPNALIGNCAPWMAHTCTNNGDFAYGLFRLGKTNHPYPREPNPLEQTILSRHSPSVNGTEIPYVPNPVFLFELDQLGDTNTTRTLQFRRDVSKFLGLQQLLAEIPHVWPGKNQDANEQRRRDPMKINICDPQHRLVREDLMIVARQSSLWIRHVFLKSPTVFVSSRVHFEKILQGWMNVPCRPDEDGHHFDHPT